MFVITHAREIEMLTGGITYEVVKVSLQFEIYSKSILASSGRHSTSSYHSDCFILKFCVEKESGCFLCIKIIHRSAEVFKQLTPSKEFTLLVNFSLTKLWLSWSPDLPVEEFSIYIADLLNRTNLSSMASSFGNY